MLKDCLEIFKSELDENGDKLILDEYTLSDGTYIIVTSIEDFFSIKEVINIKFDKKNKKIDKSNKYYEQLCFYDYNSCYLNSNKAIKNKNIFSNNYYTFFIRKESVYSGKITDGVIDSYYDILANPYLKYSKAKKNSYEAYKSIEDELEPVNVELLEKIRKWIKENIFSIAKEYEGKDYLKIFFEASDKDYEREGKRYFVPNIYNSNDYNKKLNDITIGLPNNNMGMNSKKPYLENKTRPEKVPYLINNDEVMLQKKFFDYLLNQAALGKCNIYLGDKIIPKNSKEVIDREFSGVFLRINKGMELEIQGYDVITNYNPILSKKFNYINILGEELDDKVESLYGCCGDRKKLQVILDTVLFSKYLINNYFTEPKDISLKDSVLKSNLLISRDALFNWIHKGYRNGVDKIIDKVTLNVIKNSIDKEYLRKASEQFNLRWSFKKYFNGGINMADIVYDMQEKLREKINSHNTEQLKTDDEYYYAVGQLINYFLSLSKGKSNPQSLLHPFINAKSNEVIKEKLRTLYKKYNYTIEQNSKRFNNLYGMIISYKPEGKINQDMILAGYLRNNLIYEKVNKEDK